MPDFSMQQTQAQIQSQLQIMSQKQIQSLSMLSMSAMDLREEVLKTVDANPVLEIVHDPLEAGPEIRVRKNPYTNADGGTRVSGKVSHEAEEASDAFQRVLESAEDRRVSLQDHLLHQLRMMSLEKSEADLCTRLIGNLDRNGFHILAPVSLLDRNDPEQTPKLLEKCMDIIRRMDPAGTCTSSTEESLLVQARLTAQAPEIALLILDGHIDFLNPPKANAAAKKIRDFISKQASLFGSDKKSYEGLTVTPETVQEAIDFIRTLDPFPARDFTSGQVLFIAPDVYVEELPPSIEVENNGPSKELREAKGIITVGKKSWRVRLENGTIPQIMANEEISQMVKSMDPGEGKKMMQEKVREAVSFVQMLEMRKSTIQKASELIVKKQHAFFEKGPGNLVPFKQEDLAAELGVHESTVSRMARSKYIQCHWGLFEVGYFFVSEVTKSKSTDSNQDAGESLSRDKIVSLIEEIIQTHKNDTKKLSDQKICDLLSEKGVKISRRTVAKYRSQMNIGSSYERG